MLESEFQSKLIADIKRLIPGCLVFKLDTKQGLPDLLILCDDRWAALECKISSKAHHQPNQDYYVELMNSMSYARFIFPENKKEILDELTQVFFV